MCLFRAGANGEPDNLRLSHAWIMAEPANAPLLLAPSPAGYTWLGALASFGRRNYHDSLFALLPIATSRLYTPPPGSQILPSFCYNPASQLNIFHSKGPQIRNTQQNIPLLCLQQQNITIALLQKRRSWNREAFQPLVDATYDESSVQELRLVNYWINSTKCCDKFFHRTKMLTSLSIPRGLLTLDPWPLANDIQIGFIIYVEGTSDTSTLLDLNNIAISQILQENLIILSAEWTSGEMLFPPLSELTTSISGRIGTLNQSNSNKIFNADRDCPQVLLL